MRYVMILLKFYNVRSLSCILFSVMNTTLHIVMGALQSQFIQFGGRFYGFLRSTFANRYASVYIKKNHKALTQKNEQTSPVDIEVEHYEGKFKHSFRVSRAYFPYIIGSKRAIHKKLEEDTNTTIQVPKFGKKDEGIVIIGPSHGAVLLARRKIDLIVDTSKLKIRPTHFLSIPFNQDDIMSNYEKFKNCVLENYGKTARGIDKDIFQKTQKLHLTLGVLTLIDEEERIVAAKALECCKEKLIDPLLQQYGPIKIHLKGIQCMNDNPAKVRILYADIEKNEVLKKLVNDISGYFQNAGLMKKNKKEEDGVKLHVTLMNSWFKIRSIKEKSLKKNAEVTFDATDILNDYKDIVFGEINLKEIHLSQMCAVSKNGYYQPAAIIDV